MKNDRLINFMSEARSFLGLDRISMRDNEIKEIDVIVTPTLDAIVYQLKFTRLQSNMSGETVSEQEKVFKETLAVEMVHVRKVTQNEFGELAYTYQVAMNKDKDGNDVQHVIKREPFEKPIGYDNSMREAAIAALKEDDPKDMFGVGEDPTKAEAKEVSESGIILKL